MPKLIRSFLWSPLNRKVFFLPPKSESSERRAVVLPLPFGPCHKTVQALNCSVTVAHLFVSSIVRKWNDIALAPSENKELIALCYITGNIVQIRSRRIVVFKGTLPQGWSNCWIRYVIWESVKRRVTWIYDGPILIQVTLLIKNPDIPFGLFSQHCHLNVFLPIISIIPLKTHFDLK